MTKSEELNTRLTATDKASKVVDKLADKLEVIEDTDHEATLTADDKATADVTALDKRLESLTSEQRVVILKAQAKQAQSEVDGLTRKLAQAWKYDDDTITLFVEERGNAEARLEAVSAELRSLDGESAKVDITADTAKASASLDDVAAKLGELDGSLGAVGGQLAKLASPGGAIAGIGAGLLLAGNYAADMAIEADNLSRLTGDSVEEASKLNMVWKQGGFDAKDLQDVLLQMGGVLTTNAALAEKLGINLNDGRSLGERFTQVVGLLETKFDNVAERSVAASQLFGEEGVRQVNAVIASVGDLGDALEAADESAVSQEDVEAAREFKVQMRELTADVTRFAAAVGSVAVPVMSGLVNVFNDGFTGAEEFGRNIRSIFDGGAADDARVAAKAFKESERAARMFDRSLLDGLTTFEQVNAKVLEVTGSQHAANLVAVEWSKSMDVATAATEAYRFELDNGKGSVEELSEGMLTLDGAIAGAATSSDLLGQALPTPNAELRNQAEAANTAYESINDLRDALELLRNEISDESAYLDLQDGFDAVQTAAEDAYIAAAEGAEDAEAKARDYRQEILRQKERILDYAEAVGTIPKETVAEILTQLDEGKLTEAEARIALLTADRQVLIQPVMGRAPNGPVSRNPNGTNAVFNPEAAGATGGIVNRPTMALIGEAGPEAVIPLNRSRGNGPLPAGLGGAINLTVNAGINADGPEIARIIANKLREYDRKNGRR